MMFFEVFVPKGALSAEQRQQLGERLIAEFMTDEEQQSAPAEVIQASRAIEQVVVHEPDTWIMGGRPVDPSQPPCYVVRVSVPNAWRKDLSAEVIARVTRILAAADPNPRRLYDEPVAWVHVVGLPEGSIGAFGQVMGSSDIVRLITKPFREATKDGLPQTPPGTAIDPVCGMTVPLGDAALTVHDDGVTYAFCSPGCLKVFREDREDLEPTHTSRA